MKYVTYLLNKQPLASVLAIIVLTAVLLFSLFALSITLIPRQSLAQAVAMGLTGSVLVLAMLQSGVGAAAGITVSPQTWGRHWWAVSLLMSVLVITAFVADNVDMEALVFSSGHAVDWLLQNFATGFLEELWFRGACFYLLYRAWGTTRKGLYKAALVQALLFGALHLGNLPRSDLIHVLYQCGWAACIGFGFAGLVAYTRSVWPAVLLHGLINAAASVDNFFAGSAYNFAEPSELRLLIAVSLFFVFGALPGAWCLSRAPLVDRALSKTAPTPT